jgi:hypothetical protein
VGRWGWGGARHGGAVSLPRGEEGGLGQALFCDVADDGGVGEELLFEDAGGEGVGGVGGEDGAAVLQEDGAGVVGVVDLVDGAAGFGFVGGEDGGVDVVAEHALAAELGEKRGVDVEDAAGVGRGDGEQLQPAGEEDEVDAVAIAKLEDGGGEGLGGVEVLAFEDGEGDVGGEGAVEGGDAGAGGDEEDVVPRLGGIAALEVDEVLEGPAGTRGEKGEAKR